MAFNVNFSGKNRASVQYVDQFNQSQTVAEVRVYGHQDGGCKNWLARCLGKILYIFDNALVIQDKRSGQLFYVNTKSFGKKVNPGSREDRTIKEATKTFVKGVESSAKARTEEISALKSTLKLWTKIGVYPGNADSAIASVAGMIAQTPHFKDCTFNSLLNQPCKIGLKAAELRANPNLYQIRLFMSQLEPLLSGYEGSFPM